MKNKVKVYSYSTDNTVTGTITSCTEEFVELFQCRCFNNEHIMLIKHNNEFDECTIEVHLSQYNRFWKRILIAIKYIFNFKTKYGCFDEFIVEKDSVPRIISILNNFCPQNKYKTKK